MRRRPFEWPRAVMSSVVLSYVIRSCCIGVVISTGSIKVVCTLAAELLLGLRLAAAVLIPVHAVVGLIVALIVLLLLLIAIAVRTLASIHAIRARATVLRLLLSVISGPHLFVALLFDLQSPALCFDLLGQRLALRVEVRNPRLQSSVLVLDALQARGCRICNVPHSFDLSLSQGDPRGQVWVLDTALA